ncbi:MAG TPA: hypothetical protein VMU07_00515 [Candidatus Paceibacterota bacterium]|nr:hypothetical protein [Candidatus Paceibacterota bacterium]
MKAKIVAWIRVRQRELVLGGIFFLSLLLSFGFGYLADRTFNHAPIIIELCSGT